MLILGITGGTATGKSTVTRMLAELGAPTVSADALAHDLLAPGTAATRSVLAAFPTCADPADPEGQTIDRRALGRLVFADSAARTRLEALTHPAIIASLRAQIALWRASGEAPAAAAEIPLLFEANLERVVDRIVVVTCSRSDQISRLLTRSSSTEEEVYRQINAQMPLAKKEARADYLITTHDGSEGMEDTQRQVEALWKTL
jgi:dephospho-CoA kinase